jgi:2-dehydro-3-deoxygalactonokinase
MHSPILDSQLRNSGKVALIGVDWGTSNLRVMRITSDGNILDVRTDQRGASRLAADEFGGVLHDVAGDWLSGTDPVLVCGMAGARGKWCETGYRSCPVSLHELAPIAIAIADESVTIAIVPGVALSREQALVDVMRGEETQVFGLPAGTAAGLVVTPGTHSKWIRFEDDRIRDFRTFMTGDLFAAVRSVTVLGEEMGEPGGDQAAFEEGVEQGLSDRALTAALFGVRTKRLSGMLSPTTTADYLSGILIGAEIVAQDQMRDQPITLVGPPALNARYVRALDIAGFEQVHAIDANAATARGLWRIHEAHRA